MALFGYSAPSASNDQGLDPALMKQIAANSAYWSGVTDASNNAPPASSQAPDQTSAPTLKAGPLDYIMGAIFNHASPLEINAQVNAANLNASMARARMAALSNGLSSFGSAWGQGGGSSQPISDSPAPSVGGMMGSQAPTMPVNGGSYAGVPTMAALTPSIARIAMMNPDLAKILQKQAEDSQPSYQIVNGRRVITNDASAPSVVAPADDGLTSYVTDPSAPNGYRAVATPNAAAVKASAGALADLAKSQVAPPTAGAQATGLTYDPVSGLPRATGYTLAPGVASILATQAGAKATAEKAAEAQYAYPIARATKQADVEAAGPLAYQPARAKSASDQLDSINKDSDDAQKLIENIGGLRQVLSGVQTGKLTSVGNEVSSAAAALGLPGNYSKLGNAQAANALSGGLMGQIRSQLGAQRLTDADIKLINGMLPNIHNTRQGNAQIMDMMEKMANRRLQRAQFANRWAQQYGNVGAPGAAGMPNFDSAWAAYQARHPLFAGTGQ